VPDSLQGLTVFLFAIVPGFLGIRGYSRRTSRTVPDRDLYALAGAVVISTIWVGGVWIVQYLCGDPVAEWGVIPLDSHKLEGHRGQFVLFGLVVMVAPFFLGATAALVLDRLSIVRSKKTWRYLRRSGLFRSPTAWDRAWAQFSREQGAGEVLVHLVGGLMIRGGFGRRSQVDLSPSPPGLHLEEGFGYRMNDDGKVTLEGTGKRGIYLAGSEILAVYFVDGEGNKSEGSFDQPSKEQQAEEPAADKEMTDDSE
jgi:hypothetical protein